MALISSYAKLDIVTHSGRKAEYAEFFAPNSSSAMSLIPRHYFLPHELHQADHRLCASQRPSFMSCFGNILNCDGVSWMAPKARVTLTKRSIRVQQNSIICGTRLAGI